MSQIQKKKRYRVSEYVLPLRWWAHCAQRYSLLFGRLPSVAEQAFRVVRGSIAFRRPAACHLLAEDWTNVAAWEGRHAPPYMVWGAARRPVELIALKPDLCTGIFLGNLTRAVENRRFVEMSIALITLRRPPDPMFALDFRMEERLEAWLPYSLVCCWETVKGIMVIGC